MSVESYIMFASVIERKLYTIEEQTSKKQERKQSVIEQYSIKINIFFLHKINIGFEGKAVFFKQTEIKSWHCAALDFKIKLSQIKTKII